jgi:uncharacterized sporulation protein YeaH/YhbH (DUF444 family)
MGLRQDLRRFEEIAQDRRVDLDEFIQQHDLQPNDDGSVSVPITIVDLPKFEYAQRQMGGVGQADEAEQGDPVQPDDDGEDDGEPGDEEGEHEYYDMDPEEFAEAMDEEFDLQLDPKGGEVVDTIEGDYSDTAPTGPQSTLDVEHLFKEGLKRTLATNTDEDWCRDLLAVQGVGPDRAFQVARKNHVNVSKRWLQREYRDLDDPTRYESVEEIGSPTVVPPMDAIGSVDMRPDDEQYRHPEIEEVKENNVVIVNIRDVSGSMGDTEQEMVERVLTPMDLYLQGKYDNAEFVYIAHDREAWETDREEFFGITSGGGTKVSSGYELAQDILDDKYPYSSWNRYVFGAGDGDNSVDDTNDNLVPLIKDIDANLHGYVEVNTQRRSNILEVIETEFEDGDDVVGIGVPGVQNCPEAVEALLSFASEDESEKA